MSKHKYTVNFELFWSAYPRKTAKLPAFKAWTKTGVEEDDLLPKIIIQDVEKRSRLKWWPRDTTKIPHAATWINQARWEDEGWENDIKTRGDGPVYSGLVEYKPREDTGAGLDYWRKMLNRLMRGYVLKSGGLSEQMLVVLVRLKSEVYSELRVAISEEINAATDKSKARREMAFMLAETMLNRFDAATGKSFKDKVMDMSKKAR